MIAGLPVASAPNRSLSWEGLKPEATWVDSEISSFTPIALKVTGHDIETMSCLWLCLKVLAFLNSHH